MLKHPLNGRFIPAAINVVPANIPIVIGGPRAVEPPTSKGLGPVPSNAVDDYQRRELIKEGARRSTETGGSMLQRAEEAAREQSLTIHVGGVDPLVGI